MTKMVKAIPVVLSSMVVLSFLQLKVDNPILLFERFVPYGGWIEIALLSVFGGFLYMKMSNPKLTQKWRIYSWTLFSILFFTQLILGLVGVEECLMTGKLHLPIPAVIIGGSLFRLDISFMPILLLSTIILTGPAWCSQLCYFGAFDYLAASIKNRTHKWGNVLKYRFVFFILFVFGVVIMRIFMVKVETAAWVGGTFGVIGVLFVIFNFTQKRLYAALC